MPRLCFLLFLTCSISHGFDKTNEEHEIPKTARTIAEDDPHPSPLISGAEAIRIRDELVRWHPEVLDLTTKQLWSISEALCKKKNESSIREEQVLRNQKLNLLLLRIHEFRLRQEIEDLRNSKKSVPPQSTWVQEADERVAKLKEASLVIVTRAREKLLPSRSKNPPLFQDFYDVYRYVENEVGPELSRLGISGSVFHMSKNPNNRLGASSFQLGRRARLAELEMAVRLPKWCSTPKIPLRSSVGQNLNRNRLVMERFLDKLGVNKTDDTKVRSVDLSHRFPLPNCQGSTKACAAFAITSDLSTFEGVPPLSAALAYAFMAGAGSKEKLPDHLFKHYLKSTGTKTYIDMHREKDRGVETVDASLETLKANLISPEKNFPFNPKTLFPLNISDVKGRKYGVESWEGVVTRPTVGELRRLLQSGISVIASIDTESRRVVEDWIEPDPNSESEYYHVLNVVGYGTGVSPFDGRTTDYFIVRDSLTPTAGIHYRVRASDLIERIDALYKITSPRIQGER